MEEAHAEADGWPPSPAAVRAVLNSLVEEGCVAPPPRAAAHDTLGRIARSERKPKGPEALSPMQMAVLGVLLEYGGGTPDEIATRLSAKYDRPPTLQSVIAADRRRSNKTGRRPSPRGGRRRP
jgi:hypothetical protein